MGLGQIYLGNALQSSILRLVCLFVVGCLFLLKGWKQSSEMSISYAVCLVFDLVQTWPDFVLERRFAALEGAGP